MVTANRVLRYGAVSLAAAAIQVSALIPLNLALNGVHRHELPASGAAQHELSALTIRSASAPHIKAYNFSVPVDHFHNESKYEPHSDGFYPLRYWLDTSNYKPGGPVIVLSSGEFDSVARLPYLEHGIVPILTKATGGVGLILEHRYYGTSFPVSNLTTQNMRFLTTDQAMADTAYFAKNINFPGLEGANLTSPGTPWIIYGGSYAGAFAALTRKAYPDVYWGGISSSGVTAAVEDLWTYFEAARHYAPGDCAPTIQKLTHIIDSVLLGDDRKKARQLKEMFGLGDLVDAEFATTIIMGLYGLQSTNWDPEEDVALLGLYCGAITSDAQLFPSTAHLVPAVKKLVVQAGYHKESEVLTNRMLNYIGYVKDVVKSTIRASCKGKTVLECWDPSQDLEDTSLSAGWLRSWSYQVCTEWGYFVTGSGVPKDQLPLISRTITLEFASSHCSRVFNITTPPNVDIINKWGGFNFSYPRVAIIDGEQDPWRAATPHADGLPKRKSTTSEPFILVNWGVHHWDEFGLPEDVSIPGLPPPQVIDVQHKEIEFVKAWLEEWEKPKQEEWQPEEL